MTDYLLIHGACHGGWCWEQTVPFLRGAGHRVYAPNLPCDDVDADLDVYADAALASIGRPADDLVIAAHSLGGLTATVAATRVPTRRLVFIAAVVGVPGKSLAELADTDGDRDAPMADDDLEVDGQQRFRFTAKGAERLLYHDCDSDVAVNATARLRFQRSMWTEVLPIDDWPDTEIQSIACDDDRVVNTAWSERIARDRLGTTVITMPGGHSPFYTDPEGLATLLMSGI